MTPARTVHWYRVFAVYFALATILLVLGTLSPPPLHRILLLVGVMLVGAFVPIVMAIYFMRGVRRRV